MKRTIFIIITLSLALTGTILSHQQPAAHCPFAEKLGLTTEMSCSILKVPEDHNKPEGKKIDMAYVILKSKNPAADNYPLMYLMGGPGGKGLSRGQIRRFRYSPFRANRDIILFDQRGIGESSALPALGNEVLTLMGRDLTEEEELSEMSKLLSTTKKTVESKGISLANYNTFQSARDIGLLMEHFPYEKYNVMGGSYGTTLGRVLQDLYPNKLHSMIHSAPAPLKMDFLMARLKNYERGLERLFDWCQNDAECKKDHPKLRSTYVEAINKLKSQPIVIDFDNDKFTVNAQDATYLIRRALYANNSRDEVPALIHELNSSEGQSTMLKSLVRFETGYNQILNFSMLMAVSSYEMTEPLITSAYLDDYYQTSDLHPARLGIFDAMYRAGKDWHGQKAAEADRLFKSSDIPTLVVTNYYDPVTPPDFAYLYQKDLTKGQVLILDEGGHGAPTNPTCFNKVLLSFMNNPEAPLDTSCLKLYKN